MSTQNPQQVEHQLQAWLDGTGPSTELIQAFRLFCKDSQLPEKYGVALENVLSRVESSSLFTEESCSFSKKDLANALSIWLEKVQQYQAKEHP
ncbi:hypothetical protein [Polynucleobacter sp. AM-26B4]|uniref:hypothetical protein n=1 Tax=Polynucleobacter sp. AM-26B4 TaxID=2689103 RepID=UPI001C0D41D0|nr:hypothetical protein [Polynucleobacter sp. AM-26B4]MBU3586105.1 hypothetical protein [Polynucleobacter sp. AM-26B4]